MSVKVVTPREEDTAQKDDENVKPITGILNETNKPSISVAFHQI